jgi:hypothetical protein
MQKSRLVLYNSIRVSDKTMGTTEFWSFHASGLETVANGEIML